VSLPEPSAAKVEKVAMRKAYGWAASAAGVFVWIAITGTGAGQAAGIGWQTRGALQICLDAQAQKWIDGRVELVVNEDPAAGAIDDAAVAAWATKALESCAAKAGGADPASERQFMAYMAHWREHIFKGVEEIRKRSRPD
jgi:hypothetical protein